MSVSHEDISRAVGRVEGNQDGFRARMDRFERMLDEGFGKVGEALEKIDQRLKQIESREQERKGAWKVICGLAATVAAGVASLVTAVFKYLVN